MLHSLTIIIDNYDSFTYNLYQYICEISSNVRVYRNDKISLSDIAALKASFIVISPGPKTPKEAGISKKVLEQFGKQTKILGICLGHQCINEVFGGFTVRAKKVCHGKTSAVITDGRSIFKNLPNTFRVARYHSLVVDEARFPDELEISARTQDGIIMGIRHRIYPIEGLQFHPESFLTEHGKEMLNNFFTDSYGTHS